MKFAIQVLGFFIAVSSAFVGSCGEKAETYPASWWKVAFETPIPFSGPIDLGVGAVSYVHPAKSEAGQADLEITLVSIPLDLQQSLDNDPAEILAFIKSTFLAADPPADENIERKFFGKVISGGKQTISIPRQGRLEVYLVPLSDADMIAVALRWFDGVPDEKANEVIETLANSMKETPLQQ